MTLTVGSLFSGIGGFDLGLERAGMRVIWQSEIDPYASAVLRHHWPAVPNLGDVRGITAATVANATSNGLHVECGCSGRETREGERGDKPCHCRSGYADILCGGFPCQDISNAGKRAGIDGERSGLWSEFARIIGELRPRYVIVENVAALLGRGIERVLGDLAALGFDAEWHCIPASAVGAPHRRDRVWIVAYCQQSRLERHAGNGANGDEPGRDDTGANGPIGESCLRGFGRHAAGWLTEPDVGVRSHGLSAELDGDLNGTTEKTGTVEALQGLRRDAGAQDDERPIGRFGRFLASSLLQSNLHGDCLCQRCALKSGLPSASAEIPWDLLRSVWGYDETVSASHRRQHQEQLLIEHPDLMRQLSYYPSPPCPACWADGSWEDGISRVAHGIPKRVDRLRCLGNAIVPQIAEIIGRAIVEREHHGGFEP